MGAGGARGTCPRLGDGAFLFVGVAREEHVGDDLAALAEVLLERVVADLPAPVGARIADRLLVLNGLRQVRRRVGVRVDGGDLVVIVRVGMLVARRPVRIFHARVGGIGVEVLVLVGEAVIVADLLAGHRRAPRRRIVRAAGAVIIVVELGLPLADMSSAGEPDRADAEPAGAAVAIIAAVDAARARRAGARSRGAGDLGALDPSRAVPVVDGGGEVGAPGGTNVVADGRADLGGGEPP